MDLWGGYYLKGPCCNGEGRRVVSWGWLYVSADAGDGATIYQRHCQNGYLPGRKRKEGKMDILKGI